MKNRAVKESVSNGYKLLYYFGGDKLSEQMINDAENFLFKCITKHDADKFNELFIIYHKIDLQFDLQCFPPISESLRQQIMRAHFCCYIWLWYAP